MVGRRSGVDEFVGAASLTAPLQIPCNLNEWHPHIDAHVLLVAVPFVERPCALVVIAERHEHPGAKLPVFPVVGEGDDVGYHCSPIGRPSPAIFCQT